MRLIDADEAIKLFEEAEEDDIELYGVHIVDCFPADRAKEIVNRVPTIDAVPVVRCGECKHNVANWTHEENDITDYTDITCDFFMTDGMKSTDFCSYGERKE